MTQALVTQALIVVDVQNDFCEGGSMGVSGGAEVAFRVGELLRRLQDAMPGEQRYAVTVATRDHHIDPGGHFSDRPDFAHSFPRHCVAGTDGAAFHPNLDPQPFDAVFSKGEYSDGYSGFEGKADGTLLAEWLRSHGITDVDVCGIATDFCVRATALDAVQEGFRARVLTDLVAGVAPDSTDKALTEMRHAGVTLT